MPDYVSESSWLSIRVAVLMVIIGLRLFTLRDELQFAFNESYFLVQNLMSDKNEKIFKYV